MKKKKKKTCSHRAYLHSRWETIGNTGVWANGYLGKECSRQRQELIQRPWGRRIPGIFERLKATEARIKREERNRWVQRSNGGAGLGADEKIQGPIGHFKDLAFTPE